MLFLRLVGTTRRVAQKTLGCDNQSTMADTNRLSIKSAAIRTVKNPHFWVVLVMCGFLLLIYQVWPWRQSQLDHGFWRYFQWLDSLAFLVVDVELRLHILGVLFFIPIIYGSLTLSWPGGLLAWLLSLIWLMPMLLSWSERWVLANLVLLLLPVLLAAAVTAQRRWREGEKRYYAERERERSAYISKLVQTQETERQRLAQELHDETLQTLMVIANKCDSLASSCEDERQVEGNHWIKNKILQSMDDLRRLSLNLRPNILDNFGLLAGIRWLVNNNNQEQNGCTMQVKVTGDEHDMSKLAELTIFRFVQEAIANIQRHAHAKSATVSLEFKDDEAMVEIEDDGVGFILPDRLSLFVDKGKLGMIGMEQRVVSAGGSLSVVSHPDRGTRLRATVPYAASTEVF